MSKNGKIAVVEKTTDQQLTSANSCGLDPNMLNKKAHAYLASKTRSLIYWWTLLKRTFLAWGKLVYKLERRQWESFISTLKWIFYQT